MEEGIYGDTATNMCQPCHSDCSQCYGWNNYECMDCVDGKLLQNKMKWFSYSEIG